MIIVSTWTVNDVFLGLVECLSSLSSFIPRENKDSDKEIQTHIKTRTRIQQRTGKKQRQDGLHVYGRRKHGETHDMKYSIRKTKKKRNSLKWVS